jgi:glucose-6-phosphate isomerase
MYELLMKFGDLRRMGAASLDICYVAAGRVDGFCELKLSPWDFAAGALILEEAGGKITDFSGKELDYVNKTAMLATLIAHNDGGVPNILIELDDRSAHTFGYLVYFFELACAVSGYMLGVNPFNQPGVEAYKKNMFALLGKPGYEDMKKELENRIAGV